MKISNRLKAIVDLVDKDDNVLDVGCDHAFLSIYIAKKYAKKVVASDINKLSIKLAKSNTKKFGVEDLVELVVAPNLDALNDSIDTIILAGLGGATIANILNTNSLINVNKIILSMQSKDYLVRLKLSELGFYIDSETVVEDNNRLYLVIKALKGKKHLDKLDIIFGPILRRTDNILARKYLEQEINYFNKNPKNDYKLEDIIDI